MARQGWAGARGELAANPSGAKEPQQRYRTYMPDGTNPPPVIRGWKRYWPRDRAYQADRGPCPDGSERVQSTLRPLGAGTRFRATVRFHNLRPFELGALLFALGLGDWIWGEGEGGAQRHTLGMGKPYGFGTVRLAIGEARLRPNAGGDILAGAEAFTGLDEAYDAYVETMTAAFAGFFEGRPNEEGQAWSSSHTIKSLRTLTRACPMPDPAEAARLRVPYPRIEMKGCKESNDFAAIKGQTGECRYALPLPLPLDEPSRPAQDETPPQPRKIVPPSWLTLRPESATVTPPRARGP